jgi:hypothetical protein
MKGRLMTILPLNDDDPDPIDDEAEPTFWTPKPGNAVDEDLEGFYFDHLLVDDPEAARLALVRIYRALDAWTDEVASWCDATDPPLWCPGCGYWTGGQPCTDPGCTGEPKDDDETFELEPTEPGLLLTLVQATPDEDGPCCANEVES